MSDRNYKNPLDCPVTKTVFFIGGRWKPIILHCLTGGKLRFGQLVAAIPTISRKILTAQLKELAEDRLIQRKAYNEMPRRVEYELTELGESITPVLNQMSKWGNEKAPDLSKNILEEQHPKSSRA